MRSPHSARLSAALVAAALVVGGCGSKSPAPAPAPRSSASAPAPTAAPPPVQGVVHFGKVAGRIPPKFQTYVLRMLAQPVNQWLDHAYVDGPWPAKGYSQAFSDFTPRAARQAHHAHEMSLGKLGQKITGVQVKKRRIVLDVVTARLKPIGATARFRMWLVTQGSVKKGVAVRGAVYLMPTKAGWRIFGYDVKKVSK